MSLAEGTRRPKADREIERDVLAEVRMRQDVADQGRMDVTVDGGVVQLRGFVASYAQKVAIERAVGRIVGVRDVRDYVEVRPREHDQRDDWEIERAAAAALQWDARVPAGVHAEVTNGVVRLEGDVARFAQREAADEAVRNLVGVRDIVNEIRLVPVPSSADLEPEIVAAIHRRLGPQARQIQVAANAGVITLAGVVPSFELVDDVEYVVQSIPGVARVVNQLLVA